MCVSRLSAVLQLYNVQKGVSLHGVYGFLLGEGLRGMQIVARGDLFPNRKYRKEGLKNLWNFVVLQ